MTSWITGAARSGSCGPGSSDLTDRQLAARPPGDDNVLPLWRYLVYVVTHGIQQFSEAAVLLSRLGHSPGEIGFLAFSSDPGAGMGGRG